MNGTIKKYQCLKQVLIGLSILVCACLSVSAEDEEIDSNVPAFEAFKIVMDRNIFDPKRIPLRERQRPATPSAPRVDVFTLLGVMIDQGKSYAFFSGTSSSYNAVLEMDGTIEGYRIARLNTDCVTLEKDGKEIALNVSTSMTRTEGGEWKIDTTQRSYSDSGSGRSGFSSRSGSRTGSRSGFGREPESKSASNESTSDILKKLMERRKQELDK